MLVKANEATAARRRVYFQLVDETDFATPETGEAAGQPQVSTNGGAWTNTGIGTLTAIGNGRYYADVTQAAVATAGDKIETRYKSANTAECPGDSIHVVAFDPHDATRLGLTALPNAAADAAGGLPISDAGGLDLDTFLGRIDVLLSTRSTYAGADTAGTTTLLGRLTSTRSGYLDNLSSGAVALESSVQSALTALSNLNNLSALANLYGSPLLEIPDAGSTSFAFTLVVRDNEGKLVSLDALPTITAANAAGTDRTANLSAVSQPATGRYTFTYSVSSAAAAESLRITCSGAVSAEARYVEWIGAVVDYDSIATLAAIKAKTDNLPASPAAVSDIPTAAEISTQVAGDLATAHGAGSWTTADVSGLATSAALATAAADAAAAKTAAQAAKAVTDKLDTAVEADAAVYRFTANALEQAPAGGGGGSLTVEQAAQLESAYNKTLLLGTGDAPTVVTSVNAAGKITLYQGVDYLASLGRSIDLVDADGSTLPAAGSALRLQARHPGRADAFEVDGTVVDPLDGSLIARFDVARAETSGLQPDGRYAYYVYEVIGVGELRRLDITGTLDLRRGLAEAA